MRVSYYLESYKPSVPDARATQPSKMMPHAKNLRCRTTHSAIWVLKAHKKEHRILFMDTQCECKRFKMDLNLEYIKSCLNSTRLLRKWAKDMNRLLPERIHRWNISTLKDVSIITIRETQIKITMNCHHTPISMTKIKKGENTKCW